MPETRPGVLLGDDEVCNGCRNVRGKAEIDWSLRASAFRKLVANVRKRGRDYDCVIPVSGGKDSYWQVLTCLEYGLRPLCVTYVCPGRTELGATNLKNLVALGVDHIEIRVNPKVERRFVEKAFRRTAISGLVTHMGIFSAPINVALRYDIPLVLYGENSAFEYGSEDDSLAGARLDRKWLRSFGVTAGTTAADWVGDGLTLEDLSAYSLPPEELLEARGIQVTFLGWYFRWDPENSYRVASANGFSARPEGALTGHLNYVNIDDEFIAIHHHPKWHKFGITRSWDTLSIEIRMGRMTRDQAIHRLREQGVERPSDAILRFCDYLGIDEREYAEILERFRNPEIWSKVDGHWTIDDFLIPDFSWVEESVTA